MYLNSAIVLQQSGLYRAIIRYSNFYFFISEEHESFRTLEEAQLWLLNKRCHNHADLITEESMEQKEEEEENVIEGNVFVNDSDDEVLFSDSESECESTEQQRNIRLNKVLSEIKKKGRRGFGKI